MKYIILLLISFNAFGQNVIVGSGANQLGMNGQFGKYAFIDQLELIYSASISDTEAITESSSGFIASCTNADPSVCTLVSGFFLSDPKCWAQPLTAATIAVVTADTTSSVTIDRTDAATPFKLFCHGVGK